MASVPYKNQRPKKRQARQTAISPGNRQEQVTQQQVTQQRTIDEQVMEAQAPAGPPVITPSASAAPRTGAVVTKRVMGAGDAIYLTGLVTAAMVSGIILLLWLVGK